MPAKLAFGSRKIDGGTLAITRLLREHLNAACKRSRDIENRVRLPRPESVSVTLPFLSDEEKASHDVIHMRKIARLRPRGYYRQGLLQKPGLFKYLDNRSVLSGALSWPVHVIEVGNRVAEVKPCSKINNKFGVARLCPGVGALIASESPIGKFSA